MTKNAFNLYLVKWEKYIQEGKVTIGEDEEFRQFDEVPYWFVSNKGRVISVYKNTPKVLKPAKDDSDKESRNIGYYSYRKDGVQKKIAIYRIVAMCFPENMYNPNNLDIKDLDVHHIIRGGEKKDNSSSNLQPIPNDIHDKVITVAEKKTLSDIGNGYMLNKIVDNVDSPTIVAVTYVEDKIDSHAVCIKELSMEEQKYLANQINKQLLEMKFTGNKQVEK